MTFFGIFRNTVFFGGFEKYFCKLKNHFYTNIWFWKNTLQSILYFWKDISFSNISKINSVCKTIFFKLLKYFSIPPKIEKKCHISVTVVTWFLRDWKEKYFYISPLVTLDLKNNYNLQLKKKLMLQKYFSIQPKITVF